MRIISILHVVKYITDGKSQVYREVMPAVLPLALASGLSVLLSILVLIPVVEILYLTFIVMTVYRSFLYSLAAAFLSAMFVYFTTIVNYSRFIRIIWLMNIFVAFTSVEA